VYKIYLKKKIIKIIVPIYSYPYADTLKVKVLKDNKKGKRKKI
jgi:hypothetical protein